MKITFEEKNDGSGISVLCDGENIGELVPDISNKTWGFTPNQHINTFYDKQLAFILIKLLELNNK